MGQNVTRIRVKIAPGVVRLMGRSENSKGASFAVANSVVKQGKLSKAEFEAAIYDAIDAMLGPRHRKGS